MSKTKANFRDSCSNVDSFNTSPDFVMDVFMQYTICFRRVTINGDLSLFHGLLSRTKSCQTGDIVFMPGVEKYRTLKIN